MSNNEEIQKIEQQIKDLENKKRKLQEKEKEEILDKNWAEIQFQIDNITRKDCLCRYLTHNTKTIDIFDSFLLSTKEFLLLERVYFFGCPIYRRTTLLDDSKLLNTYFNISLIIIKSWKKIRRQKNNLTITSIKNNANKNIDKILNPSKDLDVLLNEIKESVCNDFKINYESEDLDDIPEENFYFFNNPISLHAQTSKNREGYGNIYNGQELIYAGTKYGETTEFLIVGALVHK